MANLFAQADSLSDDLHRSLASGNGRCWLVIDPVPRPLVDTQPFDAAILDRKPIRAPSPAPDVDTRHMPLLVELDSAQAADSGILRQAIEEALAECGAEPLAQGAGRRICGWLESSADGGTLARHLADRFILRPADDRPRKLRWFDPAVLWAMWPLLEPAQRKTLLGPIDAWWLLDPAGRWLTLRAQSAGKASAKLNVDADQLAELGRIGALNRALREWGAADALPDALINARVVATAALRRAAGLGFGDADDLAAFALRALTVDPRFDAHALVRERLAMRQDGDYFTGLVDDLKPEDWLRIRAEAHADPAGGSVA